MINIKTKVDFDGATLSPEEVEALYVALTMFIDEARRGTYSTEASIKFAAVAIRVRERMHTSSFSALSDKLKSMETKP